MIYAQIAIDPMKHIIYSYIIYSRDPYQITLMRFINISRHTIDRMLCSSYSILYACISTRIYRSPPISQVHVNAKRALRTNLSNCNINATSIFDKNFRTNPAGGAIYKIHFVLSNMIYC